MRAGKMPASTDEEQVRVAHVDATHKEAPPAGRGGSRTNVMPEICFEGWYVAGGAQR